MLKSIRNGLREEVMRVELKDKIALVTGGDRIASPEEIAHAVIFLIENDYITGSVVNMNGGRYML